MSVRNLTCPSWLQTGDWWTEPGAAGAVRPRERCCHTCPRFSLTLGAALLQGPAPSSGAGCGRFRPDRHVGGRAGLLSQLTSGQSAGTEACRDAPLGREPSEPRPGLGGEEGQAGPKPEQLLLIREGARAPGRQQLAAPDGAAASGGPSCSCLGRTLRCRCAAGVTLLGSRQWQRPPGRTSFCGFLARTLCPLAPGCPQAHTQVTSFSLCVTRAWGPCCPPPQTLDAACPAFQVARRRHLFRETSSDQLV